jgi:two-component system NtrC family sensor kinase
MKKLLVLIIFLISGQLSFGQEDQIIHWYDSIQSKLRGPTTEMERVDLWSQSANFHKFSRPDSGIFYSTKALALARKIAYSKGELQALHYLGLSHQTLRNDYASLKVNLETLRISREVNDKEIEGKIMLTLGEIYFNSGDFEKSQDYFRKSYSIFKSIGLPAFEAITGSWVGRTWMVIGKPDSAFFYSYQAKELANTTNIFFVKGVVYRLLGLIHRDMTNADSALYYLNAVKDEFNWSEVSNAKTKLEIAKIYQNLGNADSSIFYGRQALDVALKNSLYSEVTNASSFLSTMLKPTESMQFAQMALAYNDSLTALRDRTSFSDVAEFDEQLRQYELETAKAEFQNSLRMNIFLGSTFTLLVIAFFLYRNNRQKQKSKLKIEGAYNQLKSTQAQLIQSEKMASLGELTAGIAHEIQNPLNFVNNFSEVSTELVDEMKEELAAGSVQFAVEIADDLKQNLEKITLHGKRADAIVKGMLEHSKRGSGQKELTNLNALADEFLRLSYQSFLAKEPDFKCELKTDLASDLPQVSVIPQDIGKVLLNLINNAFYAVNEKAKTTPQPPKGGEKYTPTISVSSLVTKSPSGDLGVEITVQDNGSGIPDSIKEKIFQPFFTTKPTGSGTGLGLSLSYDIVKAHGGELKVESVREEGTVFILTLSR